MAARWAQRVVLRNKFHSGNKGRSFTCSFVQRHASVGPAAKDVNDIAAMLAKPSWSVKGLFTSDEQLPQEPRVSQQQLHHLLRLSALPIPADPAKERKMLKDLHSQLQFVRAIQEVDTDGVEPLVSIRDETAEAEAEDQITLETLSQDLKKEQVSGVRGRITRDTRAEEEEAERWNALACAPKILGKYIALDSVGAKTSR